MAVLSKENESLVQSVPLFAGFSTQEAVSLLQALHATVRQHEKGQVLLMAGYRTQEIGVVLSGAIEAGKDDENGRHFVVARMSSGGVFGDVLSGGHHHSPVTVVAQSACTVLYLSYPQLLAAPAAAENTAISALRLRLLANLVAVISDKYFAQDRRINLLLTKSLRKRIATYLCRQAETQGREIIVPHTREGLAAYLGCDRSALSREISRMQKEDLIRVHGHHFTLLQPDALRALL